MEAEMQFASSLFGACEESVSILVGNFWQTLMCWKMMGSTNRGLDTPLQKGMDLRDLKINLISFSKRSWKMAGDACSQWGKIHKKTKTFDRLCRYTQKLKTRNINREAKIWFTYDEHVRKTSIQYHTKMLYCVLVSQLFPFKRYLSASII